MTDLSRPTESFSIAKRSAYLFTPAQILLASLLGTPLTGFVALLLNFHRLQLRRAFFVALPAGLLCFAFIGWLAWALPRSNFDRAWPALIAVAIAAIAHFFQHKHIENALLQDARRYSLVRVVFFIVACVAAWIALGAAVLLLTSSAQAEPLYGKVYARGLVQDSDGN